MESFRKLGIGEQLMKVIAEEGFKEPSEIQVKTIPLILQGKDVIGGSATGSGKTLAFGAGIVQFVERGKGVQALVLAPTRELAEQVCQSIRKYGKFKGLFVISIYGGVSMMPQIDNLRKADVVVGTPGRVLDLMRRGDFKLDRVKILVLDEADRMLDMGFIDDVEQIIRACPKERQTLLFSATIEEELTSISRRYMKDPVKVSAEQYVDPKKLSQCYYNIQENQKLSLLVHLLKHESSGLVMVFCNTQSTTDFVCRNLKTNGVEVQAMHGGYSQARRKKVLDSFKSQGPNIIACTDVAARGLHIEGVTHIYNYNQPADSKQYVHRIGRTARAGKDGKVINLLSERDYENFDRILRDYSLDVQKIEAPQLERIRIVKDSGFDRDSGPRNFGQRGRGGFGRGSGRGPPRGGFGPRREGSGGFGRPEGRSEGFGRREDSGSRGESSFGSGGEGRSSGGGYHHGGGRGPKRFGSGGRGGGFRGNR